MELAFNIDGEFITETARSWFYEERKPYQEVEELLLSCMHGTNIPVKTLKKYVEDILKYKRKFTGKTSDNTFCLVEENEKENFLSKYYNDIKQHTKIPFERCEYGFITPTGKYIPVGWCNHSQWASNYLKENLTEKDWLEILDKYNCNSTDALVEGLHWILIDNPHHGIGIVNKSNFITKAQKETLYDYYMFFNRKQEANQLYKEEL